MAGRPRFRLLSVAVWTTAAVMLALGVGGAWLLRPPDDPVAVMSGHPSVDVLSYLVSVVPFVTVGAFLVVRRPRNLVGWFLFGGGSVSALHAAASGYAILAWVRDEGGALPGAVLAAWIAEWAWIPAWGLVFFGIAFVFPDGRLPSRRWRLVAAIAVVLPLLQIIARAFSPGPLQGLGSRIPFDDDLALPNNPVGVPWAAPVLDVFNETMEAAFVPLLAAAVVAQVLRYRRGDRTVRLQIRWLLVTVAAILAAFLLEGLLSVWEMATGSPVEGSETWLGWFLTLLVAGYPIAVAVAVLRYRLYQIDRLLNRTAVYASVTAVLAAMYGGLVVGFQALLRPYVGGRDLAVAGSTLAVAAAFGPVRRRAQRMVDRRFDRARYDAQRTVEAFAQRLRHEVDLDALTDDLQAAVAEVLRPRLVVTWTVPRAEDAP